MATSDLNACLCLECINGTDSVFLFDRISKIWVSIAYNLNFIWNLGSHHILQSLLFSITQQTMMWEVLMWWTFTIWGSRQIETNRGLLRTSIRSRSENWAIRLALCNKNDTLNQFCYSHWSWGGTSLSAVSGSDDFGDLFNSIFSLNTCQNIFCFKFENKQTKKSFLILTWYRALEGTNISLMYST